MPAETRGHGGICAALGLLSIALGAFLTLQPSVPTKPPAHCNDYRASQWPECNVSHGTDPEKFAVGQTLLLSGAVFLAAAWRPR